MSAGEASETEAWYCRIGVRAWQSCKTSFKNNFCLTPAKHGPPTCANCKSKAAVYCVECKKPFCRFCAVLLHHPSTKNEKHSLEEIDFHQIPVKILSPVLLDICIIFAAASLLGGPGITAEYFGGQSYCPALSRGRRWLAQVDTNVFFYYKAHLSKYCDWEDSYWRFFVDTWVRGVLTNADGWLIIASQLFRAVLFEEFLRILVTPIVAVAYACIASVVRLVEWELSFFLSQEQKETFNEIGRLLSYASFASSLAIKDKKAPPPPTHRRKRPMTDILESLSYRYDRCTRLVAYYRLQAQTACRFFFRVSIKATAIVRVASMFLGPAASWPLVQVLGLEDVATKHVRWFADSVGVDAHSLKDGARIVDTGYSDWLASQALQQASMQIPLLGQISAGVSRFLTGGLWALLPHLRRVLVPCLLICGPVAMAWRTIIKQRKQFENEWKKATVLSVYGPMTRDNPCYNWKEVQFSPPEAEKSLQ